MLTSHHTNLSFTLIQFFPTEWQTQVTEGAEVVLFPHTCAQYQPHTHTHTRPVC